jgi:hypothetical protein
LQGFIISDLYGPAFDAFLHQMSAWITEGKVKLREDIVEGLENAPGAFIGLLEGKNFGKDGRSSPKFRTRRQSHICEMPRYRAVLSDFI